jgi:hypothetical protein
MRRNLKVSIRSFLLSLLVTLTLHAAAQQQSVSSKPQPNVILGVTVLTSSVMWVLLRWQIGGGRLVRFLISLCGAGRE